MLFPNLCNIKEKQLPPLLLPPMIPENLCLSAWIWRMIVPMWSMRYSPKGLINHELLQGNQGETIVKKEKLPPGVESMGFRLCVFNDLIWWRQCLVVFSIFGQQALFWYFVDNVDIYILFGYDINYFWYLNIQFGRY